MTEASVGHLGFQGFTVLAIVVGSLSLTVLAILARRRKSGVASVVKRSTVTRAALLVVSSWIVLAVGCAAEQPTLSLSGGPPQIPHAVEGRDQCLLCHEAGVAGAPKAPANHVGRTSDLCRLCHMRAAAPVSSPGVSAAPIAAGATAIPTAGPGATAPGATAPGAPATGLAPAAVSPTSSQKPGEGDGQAGKAVYNSFCNACHPSGRAGVGPAVIGLSEEVVKAAVRQGKGGMPAFKEGQISETQMGDMLAYVKSLK